MRFHFDPNRTRLQKQPKIDSPKKEEIPKQELTTQPIQEQVVPQQQTPQLNQISKKEIIREDDEHKNDGMFEPKEGWIQPPEYQTVASELEMPKCEENQLYLALYEQCFNDEVKKFKEFFAQFPDLVYYCDKMAEKMNLYIENERRMKQLYCQEEENTLPIEIKKMELQNQIKQYERSIDKFQAAQQKIKNLLQGDISKHPSVQMIHQIQCNEQNHEQLFLSKLSQFEEYNDQIREQLIDRTNQHFIKLSNDSRQILMENKELEEEIEELEKELGNGYNENEFSILNSFN